MIKVVRGNPTPEELAAALAVVQARAAATLDVAAAAPVPPTAWSDPGSDRGYAQAGARAAVVGAQLLARIGP